MVGDRPEEIIRRVYPQDRDSIRYFGEQLEKHGIIDGLRQKGAKGWRHHRHGRCGI